MLCRVAEDVFWMSRYVERAIAVVRLIDVTGHLELDAGDPDADDRELWAPVLASFGDATSVPLARNGQGEMTSADVRSELAFNPRNPNSLVSCVRRAREAARGVRETISSEMWEQRGIL